MKDRPFKEKILYEAKGARVPPFAVRRRQSKGDNISSLILLKQRTSIAPPARGTAYKIDPATLGAFTTAFSSAFDRVS